MNRFNRLLWIIFTFCIICFNIYSSSDEGIRVLYGKFMLECRYDFSETNIEDRTILDFFKPDKLMWTFIRWINSNKDILKDIDDTYTFYFFLEDAEFRVANDSGTFLKDYSYGLKQYSEQYFFNILNNDFKLSTRLPKKVDEVRLYMVYSQSYLDNEWMNSDIYIGALPGNMVTMKYGYTLFFWEKKKFKKYIKKLGKDEYNYKVIKVTKENINAYMR